VRERGLTETDLRNAFVSSGHADEFQLVMAVGSSNAASTSDSCTGAPDMGAADGLAEA